MSTAPRIDLEWLAELCRLPGVSGDEAAVRACVWRRLRPLAERAWVDPLGSLLVTRGWETGRRPRVVLAAHLDEVGLLITAVEDDGLLRFAPVGGLDPRILPGCPLRVGPHGLPGCVAVPPVHLAGPQGRDRVPEVGELRIDIGAADGTQAGRAVSPGERAVFEGPCGPLGRLFRAKALDDRAGVVALVAALEALGPPGLPLAVACTAQEEIGTRGAAAAAEALGADITLIVETTTAADLPGVPLSRRVTRLGGGPALTALDGGMIAHGPRTAGLVAVAAAEGLPLQWKEAAAGGTDGARFQAEGAEVAVLSLPCRYLHTAGGLLDPADLDAAARLLHAWLEKGAPRA